MSVIICNRKEIGIDWEKVININHENALVFKDGYAKFSPYKRKIEKIITHYDVCTSASKCYKVCIKGNYSTHFCIDNDGTIFQFLDTKDKAWHTIGSNSYSIGVDLSTAYDLKYQDHYIKTYGEPKPVIQSAMVHGQTVGPYLGFYPIQIEAYKQLLISLVKYYKIPLRFPKNELGEYSSTFSSNIYKFKGILCHFHARRDKIDIPGFPLDVLIEDLRKKFALKNEEIQNEVNVV